MRTNLEQCRIGVVGIGFGAHAHVPAFRLDKRCVVTAIAGSTPERAARVAEGSALASAYGDWRDLVDDDDVDAITIAVPPVLQPTIAAAALDRGKAVFCEKPLAASLTEAVSLCDRAAKSGLPNMVDFGFPELPAWREAAAALAEGKIGRIRHAVITWLVETYANRNRLESWKTTTNSGGGALYSFGSHVLNYVESFMGPVVGLCARLDRAPGDPRNGDSLVTMSLKTVSGACASVTLGTDSCFGSGHRIEFYGDEGTLILSNATSDHMRGFRLWVCTRTSGRMEEMTVEGSASTEGRDGRIAAVALIAQKFLDWIITGKAGKPDFQDGLRVQRLLDAAVGSHVSGRWIDL
ncbi:MAG: Gfo/Idh/MocA family oxidoreductase [Pseudomonadota bacterium]